MFALNVLAFEAERIQELRIPLRSEHVLGNHVWWWVVHQFFGECGGHEVCRMIGVGRQLNGELATPAE
jgi:hypothetical protein